MNFPNIQTHRTTHAVNVFPGAVGLGLEDAGMADAHPMWEDLNLWGPAGLWGVEQLPQKRSHPNSQDYGTGHRRKGAVGQPVELRLLEATCRWWRWSIPGYLGGPS